MALAHGPDFLGIGAQRAGSTWLHKLLGAHPQVWVTPVKELHYFDDPANKRWGYDLSKRVGRRDFPSPWDLRYFFGRRDDSWYASLFQAARSKGLVAGEITPAYAILGDAVFDRIRQINPDVKIVFSMRDPIERTWSMYRNKVKKAKTPAALATPEKMRAFCAEPGTYKRSDYMETIATLERHFPRANIHYCFFDDLADRPRTYADGILRFLGVSPDGLDAVLPKEAVNASKGEAGIPAEFARAVAQRMLPSVIALGERFEGPPRRWRQRLEMLAGTDHESSSA